MARLLLILACTFVLCLAASRTFIESSSDKTLPNGWTVTGDAGSDMNITLSFALKQGNPTELERQFHRISNPNDVSYRQFLSLEQISALTRASQEAIDAVSEFVSSFGAEFTVATTGDWLTTTVPVRTAERMLQIKYRMVTHSETNTCLCRSLDAYSLPSDVAKHIDLVGGVSRIPQIRRALRKTENVGDDTMITPDVVKKEAEITVTGSGSTKSIQAVAQFLKQYYDPKDLALFQQKFNVPSQTVAKVVGPNDATDPGDEASLDIEYIIGTANGVDTWFYSTAGLHEGQEPFLEWATAVNNAPTIPHTISVSYGDTESSITPSYTLRVNTEFIKLGSRGTTVLFSSGDNGVGCNAGGDRQEPNWPASSPYVTAVGGIYLQGSTYVGDTISSGGFSNYFARPSYQNDVVENYLNHSPLPPASSFNKTGRAIPDVSSFSENVVITAGQDTYGVAGTSCASPVVGGIFGLVNDILVSKGHAPVGFANPLIYGVLSKDSSIFTDVTQGDNTYGSCRGFECAVGWDPITGFGLPKNPVAIAAKIMSM